jgi:signal transduction histidine kinase
MIARVARRLPLVARAPLLAAGMTALVGLVASWLVLSAQARLQEDRLRELVRLHVDGLSIALGPAVLRRDVWEAFDTLERATAAGAGRLALTVAADAEGRIIAASDPRRAPVDSPLDAVAAGAQPIERLAIASAATRLRVLAPLIHQGRTVGAILTELDVGDLTADRRRAALWLAAGNGLATLALSLASWLLMRRALRPLALLAERMDAGGAPAPIPEREIPRGDHEVGRLFRTYNAMAGAVEARADSERRLAERERFVSLGRLASSLAHEINNPLGGLLNAADTLRRYADRPEVVQSSAALIERGLKRLREVAQAALDHHRLDDAAAPLTPDDLDDLRLLISPEAARLDQRLDWSVEADPDALARWPATGLRQIALNLLLNASAAAGRGGRIGLAMDAGAGSLRLAVRDDGPGMDAASLARLTGAAPPPAGGGLGLRVVRELAQSLGGRIEHAREGAQTVIAIAFEDARRAP